MSAPAVAAPQFFDSFRVDRVADPETAYADARAAHAYVTRELAGATDPSRQFNLITERKRLAGIAWSLKRRWSL